MESWFDFAGVLWSAGPAGLEHIPQGLWWANGHFAGAGAAVATGNSQEAAQTLEGSCLIIYPQCLIKCKLHVDYKEIIIYFSIFF